MKVLHYHFVKKITICGAGKGGEREPGVADADGRGGYAVRG